MNEARPPLAATMTWHGDQHFTARVGKHEVRLDGNPEAAPTPVQLLVLSLAGCMAIDLVHILERGRHEVRSLRTKISATRTAEEPRRLTRVTLEFVMSGEMLPEHVERAVRLSREKYCSVWNSLRQDIELEVGYTIE